MRLKQCKYDLNKPDIKNSLDDYKRVSDIAADRSLMPSSSHLDSGAVAPAIIVCNMMLRGRFTSQNNDKSNCKQE